LSTDSLLKEIEAELPETQVFLKEDASFMRLISALNEKLK